MKSLLASLTLFCLTTIAIPAAAQNIVYENGPINGQELGWTINFGFILGDSFTISGGDTTITGFSFGAWLLPGDVLTSVQASINSEPAFGGAGYFDETLSFTPSNCFTNQFGYNICTETTTFNGPTLGNGTYWLTLDNAMVPSGDPVYWDNNGGAGCHSLGCPSQEWHNWEGTLPSEAFTIDGTVNGSTPEPGNLLLFASGVLGLGGVLRRKLL